ncbi:MAG: carbohydrate kinase family protein [Patescibacteria group bacterium]
MTYDITTVGTATIDTFLEAVDICYHKDKKRKENFYCFPVGGKVPIQNLEQHIGGNAANAAVGFSRLKLKTAIITSFGFDSRSREIINHLKAEKISVKYCNFDEQSAVNLSYILDWRKDKNDRVILSYHQPKNFKKIKWPKTKWIYLASLGQYYKLTAKQLPAGPKIIFNPGERELKLGARALLPVLRKTEILILNKQEAEMLLNVAPSRNYIFLLNILLKLGPKITVITDGKAGAWAKNQETKEIASARGLKENPKEVTGAGDAFSSGFAAGYINNKKLTDCLLWGALNAGSCIKQIGAWNGLLTLAQMESEFKNFKIMARFN